MPRIDPRTSLAVLVLISIPKFDLLGQMQNHRENGRRALTSDEADAAIKELQRRDAVETLLYLNTVRINPELARTDTYQRRFNHYYRLRQRRPVFYTTFYAALYDAARKPEEVSLGTLLQKVYSACQERHLSFCSKLLATVQGEAVVFDKNVAEFFGISIAPLPQLNWLNAAIRRYELLRTRITQFLATLEWPDISASFDVRFPEAVHLPDIRKDDLLIWAYVGMHPRRVRPQ